MSRTIVALSAVALLCGSSQLPLPMKVARSLEGLGVPLPGRLLVVRSARSWVVLGAQHRKFHDQSQALLSRLRLSPISPPLRSILTNRRQPATRAAPGPRVCGVDRLYRTRLRGDRPFKRFPLARLPQCACGAQPRIERDARPRDDLRPRPLDPGNASVFRS